MINYPLLRGARSVWAVPCVCLVLLTFCAAGAQAQRRVALPAESVVKDVELFPWESILPSPDGQLVAYQTSDPSKHMQFDYPNQTITKSGYPMLSGAVASSVWVSEVASGKAAELASATGSSWFPNWSPDSQHLAFYSDRGGQAALWIWDRRTNTTRQVSPAFIHASWWRERPLWSADGKTILCPVLPEHMTLEDVLKLYPGYVGLAPKAADDLRAPSVHMYASHPKENQVKTPAGTDGLEGVGYLDARYLSDLARIEISTGKVTRLSKRIRPSWYAYSPDETQIAILSVEGTAPRTQHAVYRVDVYSVKEATTRTVAQVFLRSSQMTRVSWSADGTRLAYNDAGACYVVDLKTGEKVKVSAQIPEASLDFSWGPPLWNRSGNRLYLLDATAGRLWEVSADGQHMREIVIQPALALRDIATAEASGTYWSPDNGNTLYIRAHDNESKKHALYSVRVQTGEATKLYEGDEAIGMRAMGALTGVSQGSGALLFSSQSAARPPDVWALDLKTRQRRPLSHLNPQYDNVSLGSVRIIDWTSLLGEHLRGTLLLPGDYRGGERYPLVVWVYGGDTGSDFSNVFAFGWGSAFNPQMWASRGYAVLYPDVPLHPGTPVDDLVSAVIPGVNKAVELGIADPDRLAVMGQSFGGYNTIALITRTPIFKAAIAMSAGATDLFEGYTRFDGGLATWAGYYEEGQGGMRGSPWELKERYFANSPLFFLDRVKTPLLIERGMMDRISADNGNVFNALRSLGKEVVFLEYEREEHVLQQPVNVIDFWNRRIDWIDRYLGAGGRTAQQPTQSPWEQRRKGSTRFYQTGGTALHAAFREAAILKDTQQ